MNIAVCIATYQRPEGLAKLLSSLAEQQGVEGMFTVVVVDNDPEGSASTVVEHFRSESGSPPLEYVVEPEPGISAARNRGVAIARSLGVRALAFIDDDEFASPYWLSTMYHRILTSGADAVSGPVEPIFPEKVPEWVRASRLYHRATFQDGAELDYASTANVLLRLDAFAGLNEPFNPEFGLTGGSDTLLFQSLRSRGGTIIWEPAGLVYEDVPASRISMRWLVRRSYRQGITLARCDLKIDPSIRKLVIRALRGLAQLPLGLLQMGISLVRKDQNWRRAVVRVARGIGMLAGLSGITYEEYQRSKQASSSSSESER